MEIGDVQDVQFQRRDWRVQRVGWIVLFAFLSAALLGLFGPGPLSLSEAESTDGTITAEYYRFARRGGAGTVTVTVAPNAIRDGSVDLWWNTAYLGEMTVDGVTPEPDSVTVIGDHVRYRFAAEPRRPVARRYLWRRITESNGAGSAGLRAIGGRTATERWLSSGR